MTERPAPSNLLEMLDREHPAAAKYVSVAPDGAFCELSFNELNARSAALGNAFRARLGGPGGAVATVVMSLADPLEFAVSFFAAVRMGFIPVPAPDNLVANAGHRARLAGILDASHPAAIITSLAQRDAVSAVAGPRGVPVVTVSELDSDHGGVARSRASDVAYIQYTSGSMSAPKPIAIRQRNVVAQLAQAAAAFAESSRSVSVNWVPLYHDMGLVTSLLRPLWTGYSSVILQPADFVRDPAVWPAEMTRWAATHTSAPDFGYALCAAKVKDPGRFNLRPIRVARSAGEPVRWRTIEAFSQAFRAAGFSPLAFTPSYGLAEATLTVTAAEHQHGPTPVTVSKRHLREGGVVAAPEDSGDAIRLVSSGRPLSGTTVCVASADGSPLEPGRVGEIVVSGPQVAGDTVRTGDMGFLWRGELVLLGRSRERFQVRGENYYGGEIENLLSDLEPRIRGGRVAALLATRPGEELPQFTIVAEVRDGQAADDAAQLSLERALRRLASEHFGLSAKWIRLVPARTLPVTTSGKIRRDECRALLESGNPMVVSAREGRV